MKIILIHLLAKGWGGWNWTQMLTVQLYNLIPGHITCYISSRTSSAKCPLRILAKNHDFRTCESLRKSICEGLRKLAKACESLRKLAKACESLRKLAKPEIFTACKILRKIAKVQQQNHICEFAAVLESLLKPAKAYLRKLSKPKYFCESIFAKACKNTLRILANTRFTKPCQR